MSDDDVFRDPPPKLRDETVVAVSHYWLSPGRNEWMLFNASDVRPGTCQPVAKAIARNLTKADAETLAALCNGPRPKQASRNEEAK